MDAESFLRFRDQLDDVGLYNRFGDRVTVDQISDHNPARAFYFTDPYGNRYELNSYDYAPVRVALKKALVWGGKRCPYSPCGRGRSRDRR